MNSQDRSTYRAMAALLGLLAAAGVGQVGLAQPYTLSIVPGAGGATLSGGTISISANASGFPSPALNLVAVTLSGTAGTGNDTGWRLFSPPSTSATRGDLSDDLNMAVSSGSVLYAHDGSAYVAVTDDATSLPNGRGFLLYIFDDETETIGTSGLALDFPGEAPTADVTVSGLGVNDQWHLMGNPFDMSFDLSSLNLVTQGFQATVQIWNPGISSWITFTQDAGTADVLPVWQGFFVERTVAGPWEEDLTFDYAGRTTGGTLIGGKRGSAAPHKLNFTLQAEDRAGAVISRDESALLYFVNSASEDWDAFDATKQRPPLSNEYALLALLGSRSGEPVDQVQRSHPAQWAGEARFPLAIRTEGEYGRYRISWPSLTSVPDSWSLSLVDDQTIVVDLRDVSEYVVEGPVPDGRLEVVISGASGVGLDAVQLPLEWALNPAYPNPFNPVTVIGYDVPEASVVRLAVFDALGRGVAVLVNGVVPAGRHQARFDGSLLGSGVYLYVLENSAGRLTRTMLLVK